MSYVYLSVGAVHKKRLVSVAPTLVNFVVG